MVDCVAQFRVRLIRRSRSTSPDAGQRYLFVCDGTNNEIHMLLRETGKELGAFGRQGRNAGEFHWVHTMAIDSHGNVFAGDVDTGKRVQRFERIN